MTVFLPYVYPAIVFDFKGLQEEGNLHQDVSHLYSHLCLI